MVLQVVHHTTDLLVEVEVGMVEEVLVIEVLLHPTTEEVAELVVALVMYILHQQQATTQKVVY